MAGAGMAGGIEPYSIHIDRLLHVRDALLACTECRSLIDAQDTAKTCDRIIAHITLARGVEEEMANLQESLVQKVRVQDEEEMGPAFEAILAACKGLLERLAISHRNSHGGCSQGDCVKESFYQEAKQKLKGESTNRYLARNLLAETQSGVNELYDVVQKHVVDRGGDHATN